TAFRRLVRVGAAVSEVDTSQTASACQLDLATARAALQVLCPVFALVCDVEQVAGFHEFLGRLPEAQRGARLGQALPLLPDLDAPDVGPMVAGGVDWVCSGLLQGLVGNLYRVEDVSESGSAAAGGGGAHQPAPVRLPG